MKEQILNDYKTLTFNQIVKKYDLYIESQFNGKWKKMTKKEVEYYFDIKLKK